MLAPPKITAPQRVAWLDYAKAIGIVLVVFAHVSRSIGRTPGLVWSDGLQSIDAFIYAFHMPLFFLVAGYVASLHQAPTVPAFVKSLGWGLAAPYFIWSTIWIGLKVSLPDAAHVPLNISALGNLLWQPVEHFWFLYHLFFIRLGWYAVGRVAGGSKALPITLILVTAGVAAILMTVAPELKLSAGFLRNCSIYGIGLIWLPMLLGSLRASSSLQLALLGFVLWACGVMNGVAAANIWPAVGGSFVVVALARMLPEPGALAWRLFAFLGEASLAIYVMHLLIAATCRVILAKAGFLSETTLLISGTIAGLAIPSFIYWAVLSAGRIWGHFAGTVARSWAGGTKRLHSIMGAYCSRFISVHTLKKSRSLCRVTM